MRREAGPRPLAVPDPNPPPQGEGAGQARSFHPCAFPKGEGAIQPISLGIEDAGARIAQARQDIAVFIELAIAIRWAFFKLFSRFSVIPDSIRDPCAGLCPTSSK